MSDWGDVVLAALLVAFCLGILAVVNLGPGEERCVIEEDM